MFNIVESDSVSRMDLLIDKVSDSESRFEDRASENSELCLFQSWHINNSTAYYLAWLISMEDIKLKKFFPTGTWPGRPGWRMGVKMVEVLLWQTSTGTD